MDFFFTQAFTPVETRVSLCKIKIKVSSLIKYGDLLPESIDRLKQIQSELETILDHQNAWWTIRNSNEL